MSSHCPSSMLGRSHLGVREHTSRVCVEHGDVRKKSFSTISTEQLWLARWHRQCQKRTLVLLARRSCGRLLGNVDISFHRVPGRVSYGGSWETGSHTHLRFDYCPILQTSQVPSKARAELIRYRNFVLSRVLFSKEDVMKQHSESTRDTNAQE